MLMDANDLQLLRALEWGGVPAYSSAQGKLGLEAGEIRTRLAHLRQEGLLVASKPTIFVPRFLGQRWVWGCALLQTTKPDQTRQAIRTRVPFVTEILTNASIPPGIGPNISVLFHARDIAEVRKFLAEIPHIGYVEVYSVADYSFPLAQVFSSDESRLLALIAAHPEAGPDELARLAQKSPEWVKAKLERLVWSPENTSGVISVLPEVNWRQAANFMHIHFLLELSVSPESAVAETTKCGFRPVLQGRLFRNRYLQLESDVWGFGELLRHTELLAGIKGIQLAGLLVAVENLVVSDWLDGLLTENSGS